MRRRVDGLPRGVEALPPAGGAQAYAQCLYQRLREADRRGLDVLLAVPPPESGIGAVSSTRRSSRGTKTKTSAAAVSDVPTSTASR